jgi:ketopantoate reductase
MRVLIFGAGSIGQTYGYILTRSGATVDVYVRPKYEADAETGYRLYERRKGFRAPLEFKPDRVLTTCDEVADVDYDVVVLCVSSTALRGDWLDDFAPAVGDTPLVSLTPGMEDEAILLEHFSEEQLGRGMITAVSYPAPLPGEGDIDPGTAFWLPPMAPALFEGPDQVVKPLADALTKGGMKSKVVDNVSEQSRMGSAVLMPFVAVLETLDWSFKALNKSGEARRFLDQAVEEALTLMETKFDSKRPLPFRFLGPLSWKGALIAGPMVTPFDLEEYLQRHFTKVGDQTRLFFDNYCRSCDELGLECPALAKLRDQLN